MDDKQKIWTTVGSAGILDQVDLAKVSLHQSIIQLGVAIAPPPATHAATAPHAAGQLGAGFQTVQAVARYNITPVDGLFFEQVSTNPFHYALQLRYLGHVTAKLKQVDLGTGSEEDLILFDSTSPFFEVKPAFAIQFEGVLDFVKNAYYVEATLVAPALVVGHPAAISIIQVIAERSSF